MADKPPQVQEVEAKVAELKAAAEEQTEAVTVKAKELMADTQAKVEASLGEASAFVDSSKQTAHAKFEEVMGKAGELQIGATCPCLAVLAVCVAARVGG